MLLNLLISAALAAGPTTPSTPDVPVDELHDQLAALVTSRHLTAGLVRVRDGTSAWSDAVGVRDLRSGRPADAAGYFRIGSVTKTFVATVLLQLVDEGRLSLDDSIERHLPGVVPDGERFTVRHILQHTSGLHDYMSEPGYSTNRWRGDARFADYEPSELLDVAFAGKPDFEHPGESWSYSNTNYVIAGLLVEKLTGRPYGKEVERRILRPLRLTQTSVPGHHPSLPGPHARGYEPLPTTPPTFVDATDMDPSLDYAAGEMISTTRDLATFVTALLDGRLTSQESLAEMRRMRDAEPSQFRYGLGLQEFTIPCADEPKKVLGHTGKLIGYITVAVADGEGRSLVLSMNPYEQAPPLQAVIPMAMTVFCGDHQHRGVHYDEVEKAVRDMVAAADAEHRKRFGAATVVRLTSDEELASSAEIEFDEDARQACADPANSTAEQLHAWVNRMDAGTLSDGDMDPMVLWAFQALEHWAGYLTDENPDHLVELAIRSLEEVDYQVPARLDDFLGTPEMAEEFARISTLLGSTS